MSKRFRHIRKALSFYLTLIFGNEVWVVGNYTFILCKILSETISRLVILVNKRITELEFRTHEQNLFCPSFKNIDKKETVEVYTRIVLKNDTK